MRTVSRGQSIFACYNVIYSFSTDLCTAIYDPLLYDETTRSCLDRYASYSPAGSPEIYPLFQPPQLAHRLAAEGFSALDKT